VRQPVLRAKALAGCLDGYFKLRVGFACDLAAQEQPLEFVPLLAVDGVVQVDVHQVEQFPNVLLREPLVLEHQLQLWEADHLVGKRIVRVLQRMFRCR